MWFLPAIATKLEDPKRWRAFVLADPDGGHSYERLQCLDQLVVGSGVEYLVAVQRFQDSGPPTAMHDHRYPFAVLPLELSGRVGVHLYDMPWEYRSGACLRDSGLIRVCSGAAYAIEDHTRIFHAVRSLTPHLSVVMADVTRAASRENRLDATVLGKDRFRDLRRVALNALASV